MTDRLAAYVPGFTVDWLRQHPHRRHRRVDGTLAFVDVSGFTNLTERLAGRGKVGAEEMTEVLDRTFAGLLDIAYAYGGWLVKWGGDAVLLLFEGDDHAARACTAAYEMRQHMRVVGKLRTSVGNVQLRVSMGVHSGEFDFFLVGSSHRELVIAGAGATTTAAIEGEANAGEIGVSPTTRELLPAPLVAPREDGLLLLAKSPHAQRRPLCPVDTAGVDLASCLPAVTSDFLATSNGDAEHRLVAVAFVEFGGTDRLLADSPEDTAAAIDAVISAVQESATRHGVTFWETDISKDGGKVMLVAGVPESTGANEDAMLALACDVVQLDVPLRLRVGVNAGRVFFGQFGPAYRRTMSVKGDAVNLAARLMGKAGERHVVASAGVVGKARTPFDAEPMPPFMVKGKSKPISAALVRPPRMLSADTRAAQLPLVGRARELSALRDAAAHAQSGGLVVCELVGAAGVGKSRLLHELTAAADVVRVACDAYSTTSSYAPLRRLLRSQLDLDPAATPDVVATALVGHLERDAPHLLPWAPLVAAVLGTSLPATPEVEALDERFRARRQEEVVAEVLTRLMPRPQVLVIDDAHLLDAASLGLVRRLPELAERAPWLVVLATRTPLADLPRQTQRIALPPLDPTASTELLHLLTDDEPLAPHVAGAVVERAAGNPLFLTELARTAQRGGGELPESIESLVTASIDALSPRDRTLLRAIAVVGHEVERPLLDVVCRQLDLDPTPAALHRLAAFLDADHRALRFRNALLQQTAYEGLPYVRRSELHGAVADALIERWDSDPAAHAGLVSLHLSRAGRHDETWHYALLGALHAQEVRAHTEAAELYERALACVRHVEPSTDDVAAVWESLGDARYLTGEFSKAADAFRHARRLTKQGEAAARATHKSAKCAERLGAYRSALRLLTTGAALVPAADPRRARLAAEFALMRATVRHWQGRHRDAAREARKAVALAEQVDAHDLVAESLVWLDVSELMSGRGDGSPARRAHELLRDCADQPWQMGRCLNELGIRAYYAGDWNAASQAYRECQAAFETAGDTWAAAMASANAAEILVEQGRLDEAEPLLRHALRVGRASDAPGFVAFVQGLLARVAARSGRHDEARELLTTARATYAELGEHDEVAGASARLAEAALLGGDADGTLSAVDELLADDAGPLTPLLLRARGLALAVLGLGDEADQALAASVADARARGAEHEVALSLRALVAVAQSRGVLLPDAAGNASALLDRLGIVDVALPALPVQVGVPAQRAAEPAPTA